MNLLFLDSEFTGLRKDTTLISLGIESQDGRTFYAEFNDYDTTQVDDWLQNNVIDTLLMSPPPEDEQEYYVATRTNGHVGNLYDNYSVQLRGDKETIRVELIAWLRQFGGKDSVMIVSDCLAYDWVLFCDIFGGAFNVPEQVYYIPIDLCTILYVKGIDPDESREKLANMNGAKHNALYDAKVIKSCYLNLMQL